MAGLLSGFLGGVGKGLSESAKMLYDQQREDKQYERQVQRDDAMAVRQDVRDERNNQWAKERDKAGLERKLEEVQKVYDLNQKFGSAALAEIAQAQENLGPKASPEQVRAALKTPAAVAAYDESRKMVMDQKKAESSIETDKAQRASAAASAANSYDSINGRKLERKTDAEKRADEIRARELLATMQRAKQAGNKAAVNALQEEYIRLTGADPLVKKGGNWKEVEETNQYGEKKVIGWRELDTGEFRANAPAAAGGKPQKPFNPADFQRK